MRPIVRPELITERILLIRGEPVMLDRQLATLYEVRTKQVKRNPTRFPSDFVFRLTDIEAETVRTRVLGPEGSWRGKLPNAFTELGAGMLAAVLRSPRAAMITIHVLRAFASSRGAERPPGLSRMARKYRRLFATIHEGASLRPDEDAVASQVRFTYFVQAGMKGPIKIGSTGSLTVRLRTLMAMSPVPLILLGVMKGDHEQDCHTRLGGSRIHGEWFAPTATVLAFIRTNAIRPPAGGGGQGSNLRPRRSPVTERP